MRVRVVPRELAATGKYERGGARRGGRTRHGVGSDWPRGRHLDPSAERRDHAVNPEREFAVTSTRTRESASWRESLSKSSGRLVLAGNAPTKTRAQPLRA
jgi:hypothetical protein